MSKQKVKPLDVRHIAIIMDGNGRWAKQRGMTRTKGHVAGVEAVRACVQSALNLNISTLTLYSFSSENWRRPKSEIQFLFSLLKKFIQSDLKKLHEQDVAIHVIGRRDNLPTDIQKLIKQAEVTTRDNQSLNLVIAFNYGARDEIVRAVQKMIISHKQEETAPSVSEAMISNHLDTVDFVDPDIIIRTGGDKRISNFLLWQAAYSELIFFDDYWPDFNQLHLEKALDIFSQRQRRFGGLDDTDKKQMKVK